MLESIWWKWQSRGRWKPGRHRGAEERGRVTVETQTGRIRTTFQLYSTMWDYRVTMIYCIVYKELEDKSPSVPNTEEL